MSRIEVILYIRHRTFNNITINYSRKAPCQKKHEKTTVTKTN